MSDVERVREEMRKMALGVNADNAALWVDRVLNDWVPRLKRERAAKTSPKRPARSPREMMQHDERALMALMRSSPAKSNVEIGNSLGSDGGRISECMKVAQAHGGFEQRLKHLREVVIPAYVAGNTHPYDKWQRAKKT